MTSRRAAAALLVLALAFGTASCSGDDDKGDKASASSSPKVDKEAAKQAEKFKDREFFEAPDKPDKPVKGLGTGDSESTNDGDRPSVADVVEALATRNSMVPFKVSDAEAECVAKIVVDSDLSDSAVRALVKKDTQFDASKDDINTLRDLNDQYRKKCFD